MKATEFAACHTEDEITSGSDTIESTERGVVAADSDREVFGAARLLDAVTRLQGLPLEDFVGQLMTEVEDWLADDAADDASILAVEVKTN